MEGVAFLRPALQLPLLSGLKLDHDSNLVETGQLGPGLCVRGRMACDSSVAAGCHPVLRVRLDVWPPGVARRGVCEHSLSMGSVRSAHDAPVEA